MGNLRRGEPDVKPYLPCREEGVSRVPATFFCEGGELLKARGEGVPPSFARDAFFSRLETINTPDGVVPFAGRVPARGVKEMNKKEKAAKVYDEAIAPAWEAYKEAIAPAKKAYNEVIDLAAKAYDEAMKDE